MSVTVVVIEHAEHQRCDNREVPQVMRVELNYYAAQFLGLNVRSTLETAAERLLGQGKQLIEATRVPLSIAPWFVELANTLSAQFGEHGYTSRTLEDIATDVANRTTIESTVSPGILAVLAPEQTVREHKAKGYAAVNRGLIREVLPAFCLRVLQTWRRDGHVHASDEET